MTLKQAKIKMKTYLDFYGGELLDSEHIDSAETISDLERIIENHRSHMEAMLSDANSHLDHFKKQIVLCNQN